MILKVMASLLLIQFAVDASAVWTTTLLAPVYVAGDHVFIGINNGPIPKTMRDKLIYVDRELMRVKSELRRTFTYSLLLVERGVLGTKRSSHQKQSLVFVEP